MKIFVPRALWPVLFIVPIIIILIVYVAKLGMKDRM